APVDWAGDDTQGGTLAFKFDDVKSMNVENSSGEKLGKIEDLIYDEHSGQMRYGILSFGGALGLGNKLFAVPWQQLKPHFNTVNNERVLLLNIDKQELEKAPSFDKNRWPN